MVTLPTSSSQRGSSKSAPFRSFRVRVLVVSPNTMSEVSSSVLMSMKSLASRVARRPSAFRPVMVVGKVPSQSLRDR